MNYSLLPRRQVVVAGSIWPAPVSLQELLIAIPVQTGTSRQNCSAGLGMLDVELMKAN